MASFFPQKMVPECKPERDREAKTVFSRLPSLRRLEATPPLQTSLKATTNRETTKDRQTRDKQQQKHESMSCAACL